MSFLLTARQAEQAELLEAYKSPQAEFIVLYGRRRIGKTCLIENLYGNGKQKGYYFQATGIQNGALKEQLEQFSLGIGKCFYHGANISTPSTWLKAFEALTKAIELAPANQKVVIFLDELPWLCTKRSRLLQAIDYYWNQYWKKDKRIKLVVCGSSASWIIKKILHNKGGLHNRNTRTLLLKPFTLKETKEFFQHAHLKLNHEQIVQFYMFCGGVPYYLSQIKKGKSAAQMIDLLCFQPNGMLYQEFDKLFASLFDDAESYKEIIQLIAEKHEGVTRAELEKNSQYSSGGTLTNKLNELEEAGFIQSFLPLDHKTRGIYYRVIDEYCSFYLKWILPVKHSLVMKERDNQYWSSKINTPSYYNWQGYAFETLCYKHIREIRSALQLTASANVGVWRYMPLANEKNTGAQIDMLFDRDDGVVTICEIKYTQEPFVIDKNYAKNLQNKMSTYKMQTHSKKQIHLVFITNNGIKENLYRDELADKIVILEDFFH